MSTRLKMKCQSVKLTGGGENPQREYWLSPVYGPGNETWSKFTPCGVLQYTVTNPACPDLKLDAEYFVDITDAAQPPSPPEESPPA